MTRCHVTRKGYSKRIWFLNKMYFCLIANTVYFKSLLYKNLIIIMSNFLKDHLDSAMLIKNELFIFFLVSL